MFVVVSFDTKSETLEATISFPLPQPSLQHLRHSALASQINTATTQSPRRWYSMHARTYWKPHNKRPSAHRHGGNTRNRSQHRNHHNNSKDDQTGVPFALAPEVREDQSLPPWIPVKGRNARNEGRGGGVGSRSGRRRHGNRAREDGESGGRGTNGRGDGPESVRRQDGSTEDNGGEDDGVDSRVKVSGEYHGCIVFPHSVPKGGIPQGYVSDRAAVRAVCRNRYVV